MAGGGSFSRAIPSANVSWWKYGKNVPTASFVPVLNSVGQFRPVDVQLRFGGGGGGGGYKPKQSISEKKV